MANAFFSGLPSQSCHVARCRLALGAIVRGRADLFCDSRRACGDPSAIPKSQSGIDSPAVFRPPARRAVRPDLRGRSATRFGDSRDPDLRCRSASSLSVPGDRPRITGDPIARGRCLSHRASGGATNIPHDPDFAAFPVRLDIVFPSFRTSTLCSKPAWRRGLPQGPALRSSRSADEVVLFSDRQPGGDRIP